MPETKRSITSAPDYACHRKSVAAVDVALATVDQSLGMNCRGYGVVNAQVIPDGGAVPKVEALFWSEAAGAFISCEDPIEKTAPGADTPFEFSFDANGRIVFIAVTTLAGGTVDVYLGGFDGVNR